MHIRLVLFLLFLALLVALLFSPRVLTRPLSASRRRALAALQLLPLACLAWLWSDPYIERQSSHSFPKTLALVVDDSPSMGFEDGVTGEARINQAMKWVDGVAEEWESSRRGLEIRRLHLSELVPSGHSGSDFGEGFRALPQRVGPDRLGGVVFISDGRDHSQLSPLEAVRDLGCRIHTIGIGPETSPDSVHVRLLDVPEETNPGSPFLMRWSVDSAQTLPRTVALRIEFASQEVLARNLDLQPPESHAEDWLSLSTLQTGRIPLRVTVESSDPSQLLAEAAATVLVEEEPPAMVILEGSPSRSVQSLTQAVLHAGRYKVIRPVPSPEGGGVLWEFFRPKEGTMSEVSPPWAHEKMTSLGGEDWQAALESLLPSISLVILGQSPWEKLPVRWRADLSRFFDASRSGLLAFPGAEEGGTDLPEGSLRTLLAWLAERRSSPGPIQAHVPAESRDHPALAPAWTSLSRLWEMGPDASFQGTPAGAVPILVDGHERPLIYEVRFGLSRAVLVSLSDFWMLRAFAEPSKEGAQESRFVEGVWLGVVDYLCQGSGARTARIHVQPLTPALGQRVDVLVEDPLLAPGPPAGGLQVKEGDQPWKELLVSPDPHWRGLGRAVWVPRRAGVCRIRGVSSEESVTLQVLPRPSESEDRALNRGLLETLAARTGGAYFPFDKKSEALDGFPPASWTELETTHHALRHDAWFGAAVALLFCAGWGIRRLSSLP